MSEAIKGFIDQVWQSSDGYSTAVSITQRMSGDQRESLKGTLLKLMKRSESDSLTFSDNKNIKHAFLTSKPEEEELASILLLLMLAVHHSDGLAFLPTELRRSRVGSWSEQTGLKEIIVLEAVKLGPERLNDLF